MINTIYKYNNISLTVSQTDGYVVSGQLVLGVEQTIEFGFGHTAFIKARDYMCGVCDTDFATIRNTSNKININNIYIHLQKQR